MVPIIRGVGDGLFLSEGKVWKAKRKILNRVFNFEFIKAHTENIANICDYSIKEFERNSKCKEEGFVEGKVLTMTAKMFSHVIMEIFLGGDIRNAKIDGVPAEIFITEMVNLIMDQSGEPLCVMLGKKYL